MPVVNGIGQVYKDLYLLGLLMLINLVFPASKIFDNVMLIE